MILTVDIGNTNITLGGYIDGKISFISRLATDIRRTGDQYAVEIYDVMRLSGFSPAEIEGSIICSVVPTVGTEMSKAIEKLIGIKPLMIGPGVKTGVDIKIDHPSQLGADLVAGAAGTLKKYPLPCIIIDMGTATTLFVLNENGAFIGGAIAAGVNLTLNALSKNTAQLPLVPVEAPKKAIGSNTVECMQSGLVFGTAAMIDGLIERLEAEVGMPCFAVATGGKASQIIAHCKKEITLDENLLLDGLYYIYGKNI